MDLEPFLFQRHIGQHIDVMTTGGIAEKLRHLRQAIALTDPRSDRGASMAQYSGVDGTPTDTHTVHLGRLAEGGAGLVIQEGTAVDRKGRGTYADLGIWDDSLVPHYARLVDLIRSSGAVPGIQLSNPLICTKLPYRRRTTMPYKPVRAYCSISDENAPDLDSDAATTGGTAARGIAT